MIYLMFGIIVFFVWYALVGREWLKSMSLTAPFFALPAVEWMEIHFWAKSRTILFARIKVVTGLLLAALNAAGSIDLSPFLMFFPEKHRPLAQMAIYLLPLSISVIGAIDEWLRRDTDQPLAVVALPEKALQQPQVAAAVAVAEEAKAEAVAVAKEVKS